MTGGVYLGEDDATIGGGLESIGVYESAELGCCQVKAVCKEAEERSLFGLRGERSFDKQFIRYDGKDVRLVFRRCSYCGVCGQRDSKTAKMVKVLARGVVVGTGFDAFAASYFFVKVLTGEGVDVADKFMLCSTSGTCEARGDAVVGL